MGSGGYKSAETKWAKDEKVYSSADSPGVSLAECPRGARYLLARSKRGKDGRRIPPTEATRLLFKLVVNDNS